MQAQRKNNYRVSQNAPGIESRIAPCLICGKETTNRISIEYKGLTPRVNIPVCPNHAEKIFSLVNLHLGLKKLLNQIWGL